MKRLLSIVLLLMLVLVAWWFWSRQPLDLSPLANLHTSRHAMPAVAFDDKAWIVGGYSETGRVSSIEVIDPDTGMSTLRETSLIPRMYHAALVHEGRIWVIGGTTPRVDDERQLPAAIETYDPVNGEVNTVAWLPFPGTTRAAVIVSNRLYVIGGADRDGIPTGRMDIYDLASETWSRGPDMPTPRQCTVVDDGGVIFALGGYNGYRAVDTVEAFDISTGTWSPRPRLPVPQSAHRAVALSDGSVLLVGDYAQGNLLVHGDPEMGNWRVLDAPFTGARHLAATRVGGKLIIAGGRAVDDEEVFPAHIGAIHIFPLTRLLRAPDRVLPATKLPDPQRQALDVVEQSIQRQGRITTVAMSGHWDLAYEAEGRAWTNRVPYRFVLERPNRLFIDTNPYTAWHDGATYTFRFTRDGTYQRYEGGLSLDNAVKRGYAWFRQSLPFGHTALLGPDGANALRSSLDYRRMVYEGEGLWRNRPTWVLRSQVTNDTMQISPPDFRVHLDQASGVAVLIESLPWPDGSRTWPERDDASAAIARSLVYRFELDDVTFDEPVDTNLFTFVSREHDRNEVGRSGGTTHPHPQSFGDVSMEISRDNSDGASLPDLPADRFEKIWERTPGGSAAGSLGRRFIASVTPTHVHRIDHQAIRVLRVEDGIEVMNLPAPEGFSGHLFQPVGAYLPRRGNGGIWVTAPPRTPEQSNQQIASVLTAFDKASAMQWTYRLPAARGMPELAVVPLAPGAGHGLFVFTYNNLVLLDDTGAVLLNLPTEANTLIEVSDRDGDGRLEVTFHDQRIRRFVFRGE